MTVTIKRISEAKAGDTVWLFEPEEPVYREGKYVGRGRYTLVTIEERGRQSFTLVQVPEKFDLAGRERGMRIGSPCSLHGSEDYEDQRWQAQRHLIAKLVQNSDAGTLRKVAALVGFSLDAAGVP